MLKELIEGVFLGKPSQAQQSKAQQTVNPSLFIDARRPESGHLVNIVDRDLIDQVAPAVIVDQRDYIRVGNAFARTFYVSAEGWPASLSRVVWRQILTFKGMLYASLHVNAIDPASAATMIRRESSALLTQQYFRALNRQRINTVDRAREGMLEMGMLQTELMNEPLLYVTITLGLFAPSLEALNAQTQQLLTLFRHIGLNLYCADFQQTEGLVSILPIGENRLQGHQRNLSTESMARMFPRVNQEIVHPRGFFFGRDLANGSAVVIDPYELTNPIMLVMGTSGAGKSYFMKSIIEQAVLQGILCWVLDIEGEYNKLAESLNGTYVDLSLHSEHKINILDIDPSDPEGMAGAYQDFSAWVAAVLGRPLQPAEREVLHKAYLRAFADYGIYPDRPETFSKTNTPLMSDILRHIQHIKDTDGLIDQAIMLACTNLRGTLYDLAEGLMADSFNCHTTVSIASNPLVVFGMKNIRDQAYKIIRSSQIQIWMWNKILADKRRKLIVVDEAWFFMHAPTLANRLEEWARRVRKKNAALLIGTQQIADFAHSPSAFTIFSIADTRLFFKIPQNVMQFFAERAQLNPLEAATLPGLTQGQFLMHAGPYRRLIYNEVPPERALIYSTKPSDEGF